MTANWFPVHTSYGPDSGRILDTARGILIGLRRCRSDAAFDELHSAASRHRVPAFAMAWALVHLAGDGERTTSFMDAQRAARYEWGQLFGSAAVTCSANGRSSAETSPTSPSTNFLPSSPPDTLTRQHWTDNTHHHPSSSMAR